MVVLCHVNKEAAIENLYHEIILVCNIGICAAQDVCSAAKTPIYELPVRTGEGRKRTDRHPKANRVILGKQGAW